MESWSNCYTQFSHGTFGLLLIGLVANVTFEYRGRQNYMKQKIINENRDNPLLQLPGKLMVVAGLMGWPERGMRQSGARVLCNLGRQ